MCSSSRQSPTVMSPTRPPLAATMTAIRRSASCVVCVLDPSARHDLGQAQRTRGSRIRAISATRPGRGRRGQQPAQARAEHVGADTASTWRGRCSARCARNPAARSGIRRAVFGHRQSPPSLVAVRVGAAGQPPVLPGVAGLAAPASPGPGSGRAGGSATRPNRSASGSAIKLVISCAFGAARSPASQRLSGRGGNRRSNATDGEGPGVARPAGLAP